ncbi:MAG: malto-oligosyltrehalose synthase [Verrucomicrobiota bacterium]
MQLNERFPLHEALALVPYLHELGISHIYASPLFKARPHSLHGYDTCDFSLLNPELGTEEDLGELISALRARRMGLVIDIVPNHMGIGGPENRWWWDVLAHGPESPFAGYFDIDWNSPDPRLRGKVLVPILADRYHQVLAKRQLQIESRKDARLLRYDDNVFPLNAPSLQSLKATQEEINADPGALNALIERQYYRLAWHGRGDSELNYRRFFNITTLPGLCMEDKRVFSQAFALTGQWLQRGWLDGLRVDHPDGLRDPEEFLLRLKEMAPNTWIVVEKILGQEESLPASWPVAGTTGYDFLNSVGGLFVDPRGEKPLGDVYRMFIGSDPDYPVVARDKKRLVSRSLLAAEVERLTGLLLRIAAAGWRYCDFTHGEMACALIEFTACFPVYRSYVQPSHGAITVTDVRHIQKAAHEARRNRPDLPPDLFEFLANLLLLKQPGSLEDEFVGRFQQFSAAVMAKGVEDTAFYCFNRFVALNEVGGNPGRFGIGIEEFHQSCRARQSHRPASMLSTSTHDTKRGEDVRARLCLLSEMPGEWRAAVDRWSVMNQRHRRNGCPDRNAEYLYYQTLVGAWPLPVERATAYMEKAAHEAKEHTSSALGDPEYDQALRKFVTSTLADPDFLADLAGFAGPLVKPGCINSLAQTLFKLTAPGVPDFYQGAELWNLDLVDPDNRRPVDFAVRKELLARASTVSAQEAWQEWESGLPKLWLIRRVLNLRSQRPDLFAISAQYEPMAARGRVAGHVIAFKRGESLIAMAPRLLIALHDDWGDTVLEMPPGAWRNQLTGENAPPGAAPLSVLLGKFPVALLTREEIP